MDKTILVAADIRDGRKLVEALDRAEFSLSAALWYRSPESLEWRLILATPLVERPGPIEAISLIQLILQDLSLEGDFSLDNVLVVSPASEIVQRFLRKARGSELIEGLFTGDAYIYRLQKPPAPSSSVARARVNAAKHRDRIQSSIDKLQASLRSLPDNSPEATRLRQHMEFLEERRREFDAIASED
jgi:hypothetical protein